MWSHGILALVRSLNDYLVSLWQHNFLRAGTTFLLITALPAVLFIGENSINIDCPSGNLQFLYFSSLLLFLRKQKLFVFLVHRRPPHEIRYLLICITLLILFSNGNIQEHLNKIINNYEILGNCCIKPWRRSFIKLVSLKKDIFNILRIRPRFFRKVIDFRLRQGKI